MKRLFALLIALSLASPAFSMSARDTKHERHRLDEIDGFHRVYLDIDVDAAIELISYIADDTSYAQPATSDTLEVVSSDANDTTQTITVYGVDDKGKRVSESFELNGTTAVGGSSTFAFVEYAKLDAVTAGEITIREATDDSTITAIPIGNITTTDAILLTGEYDLYITQIIYGTYTATGGVSFEVFYYADDDDFKSTTDYEVIDYTYVEARNANAPTETIHTYSQALRIPSGAMIAIYGIGENANSDGYVIVQGYYTEASR